MHHVPLHRIAFIGTYPPRRCGIATYTRDLRDAVAAALPDAECLVVPIVDADSGDHPPEVRFTVRDDSLLAYRRAAEYLNFCNVDVVSLQHEYGIFGGPAGSHVLSLIRSLRMPVHTTLHTVLAEPTAEQREVMEELVARSSRLAVMTERGRRLLRERYAVDDGRIDVIPHGIPDLPLEPPAAARRRLGIEARWMLLTFGLLALFLWVCWLAMHFGLPVRLSGRIQELAPSFSPTFSTLALLLCLGFTLAWLWAVSRRRWPPRPRRGKRPWRPWAKPRPPPPTCGPCRPRAW